MTSPPYSKSRLIPAIILAIYVYGAIASLLGTILLDLGTQFELNKSQQGYVTLMYAIGLMIASISAGPIIDTRGKKVGLVAALAGITTALVCLSLAGSYGAVLGSTLLLGLSGGVLVTGANTLVSDLAEERRASMLNFLNVFFGVGFMSTPYLAAMLPLLQNTYSLCLALAGFVALTLLIHIFTKMPAPTGERSFVWSEAGPLLNQPALYLLSLMLFLYVACEVGLANWLVVYLDSRGVDAEYAKKVLSLGFGLGLLCGRLVVSRVLLRMSEIKVTLCSALGMVVTTAVLLQTGDRVWAGVMVFLAGVAMGPVFPTTLGIVGNMFTRMTATAMGIAITSGWIGFAVSSPIIGWMADRSDLGSALLLLPAMSVVLVGTNLLLRRHVSKPAVEQA